MSMTAPNSTHSLVPSIEELSEQMTTVMLISNQSDQRLREAREQTEIARKDFKEKISKEICKIIQENEQIAKRIEVLKNQIKELDSKHQAQMESLQQRFRSYETNTQVLKNRASSIDNQYQSRNNRVKTKQKEYEEKMQDLKGKARLCNIIFIEQ